MIQFLLFKIIVSFKSPDEIIVKFNEDSSRGVLFTGAGACDVYTILNNEKVKMGDIYEGLMVGGETIIFERNPLYMIVCWSYCTISTIKERDFHELCVIHPFIKEGILKEEMNKPHDVDLDYFVKQC